MLNLEPSKKDTPTVRYRDSQAFELRGRTELELDIELVLNGSSEIKKIVHK
jgi:hypothetical protein